MAEITTIIPKKFTAGETIVFHQYDSSLYPQSSGFVQKCTINGTGGKKTITANFSGGIWTFTLKANENIFTAGIYSLYLFATKGADATEETYGIKKVSLTIEASLKTETLVDQRSQAQQELDLLNTIIKAFVEDGLAEVTVGTRTYRRVELKALQEQRRAVEKTLNSEQRGGKRKRYLWKLSNA
ncbi:MAG: hypothetical protein WDA75_13580 [Candidatus Latescibacterota bacterium]|jgi:hypothetical protein